MIARSGILAALGLLFDRLLAACESPHARRLTSSALLGTLGGALLAIELGRRGLLPAWLAARVPATHFAAVDWVVELILLFEVVELIFGMARSVAGALGKQLEVFSLILLRKSFAELKHVPEPLDLGSLVAQPGHGLISGPIWDMAADAAGALAVFGGLALFRRLQRHQPITSNDEELASFVLGKKVLALVLLAVLAVLVVGGVRVLFAGGEQHGVFSALFTALVFSDIALVLLSLRYTNDYRIVFRNFGFTVVTIFVRLAITAPPLLRAGMAAAIAVYAVALAWLYNVEPEATPHKM